jgi:phosphoribosylamine--glycine ligase
MTPEHYREACSIIAAVIERLRSDGRHFNGIMNSGFFATADGVKVIEFNARFGDPECMNIMSLFDGSWTEVMQRICDGQLADADVALRDEASLVLYLVSPDYALRPGGTYEFPLDVAAIEADGCRVFFSSAVEAGPGAYRTVGTSRAVALATTAATLDEARERLQGWASQVPTLEWRRDVGDSSYLEGLARLLAPGAAPGG